MNTAGLVQPLGLFAAYGATHERGIMRSRNGKGSMETLLLWSPLLIRKKATSEGIRGGVTASLVGHLDGFVQLTPLAHGG